MSHLDILSNLFSHIQNGQKNRILVIEYMNSRAVVAVLNILQENGYIRGYRFVPPHPPKDPTERTTTDPRRARRIEILLRYLYEKPAIGKAMRISKPSRRIYLSIDALDEYLCKRPRKRYGPTPPTHCLLGHSRSGSRRGPHGPRSGTPQVATEEFMQGTLILSTPKGILSATTAKKFHVGGEVLALVCS
jgi:ribosomal protein S8